MAAWPVPVADACPRVAQGANDLLPVDQVLRSIRACGVSGHGPSRPISMP